MKKIIFCLVSLSLTSLGFTQKIDWQNAPLNPAAVYYSLNHFNLNGPVKEANSTTFDGTLFNLYFNEDGYLIKELSSESGGTLRIMTTYQYENKGVLKSMKVSLLDSKGYTTNTNDYSFTYNSQGLIATKMDIVNNYSVRYTYDSNNNLKTSAAYSPDGISKYRTEYAYNNNNQIISQYEIEPDGAENFRFDYLTRENDIMRINLYSYKNDIMKPLESDVSMASFTRQKTVGIYKNPVNYTFDKDGHEAFQEDVMKVSMDQFNNVIKEYLFNYQLDFRVVELSYYGNMSSTIADNQNSNTCLSGNCNDGFGVQKTKLSTITGFFLNGEANGYGREEYDDATGYYEGAFQNGLRNGFGTYEWFSNSQFFIGQWKDGAYHGYGYFTNDGTVSQAGYYENGEQIKNLLDQDFIYERYVGNCRGNCKDGFGLFQFDNDDRYIGFFSNGVKNFVGSYNWQGGNIYIGEYQNDTRKGQGMEFYASSETIYKGQFLNSMRHGLGAYFNKSNELESRGYWDNGEIKTKM